MAYVSIETTYIRQASADFEDVAQILLKGINATQTAKEAVDANYVTQNKSQEVKSALNDWLDFVPGFRTQVQALADQLIVVASTYEQLDQ